VGASTVPSWYGLQQLSNDFPDLQGHVTLFSVLNGLSPVFKAAKTWLEAEDCQY